MPAGADHAPLAVVVACQPQVQAVDVAGEIPGRIGIRFAPQHPDRHPHAREFLAVDFDVVDAGDQAYRLVGDQVAVQGAADLAGAAALGVAVILCNQPAQGRRVAFLGGRFGQLDQRADLGFRCARRPTGGEQPGRGSDARLTRVQDRPPIAAGRR